MARQQATLGFLVAPISYAGPIVATVTNNTTASSQQPIPTLKDISPGIPFRISGSNLVHIPDPSNPKINQLSVHMRASRPDAEGNVRSLHLAVTGRDSRHHRFVVAMVPAKTSPPFHGDVNLVLTAAGQESSPVRLHVHKLHQDKRAAGTKGPPIISKRARPGFSSGFLRQTRR